MYNSQNSIHFFIDDDITHCAQILGITDILCLSYPHTHKTARHPRHSYMHQDKKGQLNMFLIE